MIRNFPLPNLLDWLILIIALVMLQSGCRTLQYQDYEPYRVKRQEVPIFPFGSWGEVQTDVMTLEGELIAIEEGQIYWLTAENQLYQWEKSEVSSLELWLHRDEGVAIHKFTRKMMLSTLTHGWFAVFTLPSWFLVRMGTKSTVSGQERILVYPEVEWDLLNAFARFPQGLPAQLDPNALTARPAKN